MPDPVVIRPKDRDAVIQSLRAGVVPRAGQHLIQVGRVAEIQEMVRDIDRLADGGAAIRFIIGDYGAGKTFFLHLVRAVAMEKKLVTAHADLTPDRRLQSSGGQARGLYAELMRNVATRAKPDGGALSSVVEKFVASTTAEAQTRGVKPDVVIHEKLADLTEMVGGFDFAQVIAAYWRAHDTGDEVLKSNAIRWLRGEFTTRTDARNALGVRAFIDDNGFYDYLKLFARFVRHAGYAGLLVCLDELVNLYKITSPQSRAGNYEQVLRILNDSLQGIAVGLGFVLCGTPESLTDTRRGLFSYPALQSRLAENAFAKAGLVDLSGPVIRLAALSAEDLYVLLAKVRRVFTSDDPLSTLLPDDGIRAFMAHCSKRIGDSYFRTPRSTVREFVNLLAILEQNPKASWRELVDAVEFKPDVNPDLTPPPDDPAQPPPAPPTPGPRDDLASFKL